MATLSQLKANLKQTRAAREAFLRGTTVTTISNSSLTTPSSLANPTVPFKTYSINSSNRELTPDKSSVAASLNSNNGNHFYQNIQQLNKTSTLKTDGTPVSLGLKTAGSAGTASLDSKPNSESKTGFGSKQRKLEGYVGFANLPNQVYRKSVKKGFEFNLMVIGESGLGKSTFINSLFLTELYNPTDFPGTFERRNKKTTVVDATTVQLNEKGVSLKLTIVDTPGFGDAIDNSNCWQTITDYVDSKYEEYLSSESKVNRKLPINDQRIHCCLFFISPGHTLKQLDIEVMKKLHDRVNLIPVIAKADTMTAEEIKNFKKVVLDVIAENKIQIYEFPDIDDDDLENNRTNNILKSKLPFAIVGSNTVMEENGKTFRGRKYPWGVVNVDELTHCDFMALRTMLIRTHMNDLKDVTNNVHYENYRFKKLANVSGDKTRPTNKNPFQQLEEEKKEAEARLEKMKNEMEGVFDQKVKEKISRLRESELNLEKQQEVMKASLEKEERELEEKRQVFLREKQQWEEANREEEEKLKQTLDKEMKLICELFRKSANSSVHGKCYESFVDANKKINSQNFTELIKALASIAPLNVSLNSQDDTASATTSNITNLFIQKRVENSAIYLIVVMCFYSLSLLILVFLNVKFNVVFRKKLGLRNCYLSPVKADLYDQQQQETKETIELLFSHSSKLLASPVISFAAKNLPQQQQAANSTTVSVTDESVLTSSTSASISKAPQDIDRRSSILKQYDRDLIYTLV